MMRAWVVVVVLLFVAACREGAQSLADGPGLAADAAGDGPSLPRCSDHLDNDGDGKTDYPDDPGCPAPQADDEADDCPGGARCPQCANQLDDDASGSADYPNPGCTAAADDAELLVDPVACGAGLVVGELPASGVATGTLDPTSVSDLTTPCGGGNGAPAVAYAMVLDRPTAVVISTVGSVVDTVLDLRAAPCGDTASHLACSDDVSAGDPSSKITRSLDPDVYYIIVEARDASQLGAYRLTVERRGVEGAPCDLQSPCGPGLICRIPAGATDQICMKPVCNDGVDDDADGRIDYPTDPGCATPDDATEDDACPDGPGCPACADGDDDDGDSLADYPADPSCQSAADISEACMRSEPMREITGPTTTGTTTGAVNDYDPTCNATTGLAPDLFYRLDLPAMSVLTLRVTGFDTVHSLLDATCGGTPIACSDPALMTRADLAAGTYYLGVEGKTTTTGAFTIETGGTIAPHGSCEGALYQSGAIACPIGFVCDGPPGARTCTSQCTDGIDNNGDGAIDYPNDPGCAVPGDDSEDTVCPGPACPACSDGLDNDRDTLIDWPADPSCLAAGGASELCPLSEPIGQITATITNGTTVGATDDFDPTCNLPGGLAPDVVYRLDVPAMASLDLEVFGLPGFDAVHSLLDSSCASTLRCSDPALMTVSNLAAGVYFVSIEGTTSAAGAFTLTTRGVVALGGSCEGALVQAGVFTCAAGTTCDGPPSARTCRSQCSDGADNNGDGRIDYPSDPGCATPTDNSEDTVCPGPLCPACSDGVDNDGDLSIDYPMDPQCLMAAGSTEQCATSEPIGVITTKVTTGATTGMTDDYVPSCGASPHTAPDAMWALDVPSMKSLSLALVSGSFAATQSLLDASCSATPLACKNSSTLSMPMTVNDLPAGRYHVVIDGRSNQVGSYALTTLGVIAPGERCEHPLVTAGAFQCASGSTCQGPPGSKQCL